MGFPKSSQLPAASATGVAKCLAPIGRTFPRRRSYRLQGHPKKLGALCLLLAAVTLVGSANGAEPADPHRAAQNAESEMAKCFFAQAASLDDHVSDASAIAQGVVSACHPLIDDWKYANFEELRPLAATKFYEGLDRAAHDGALEVVLKVRAAARH